MGGGVNFVMLYICVCGSAVRNVGNGARFWGWCVRGEGWLVRGGWCVRGVDDNRKGGCIGVRGVSCGGGVNLEGLLADQNRSSASGKGGSRRRALRSALRICAQI